MKAFLEFLSPPQQSELNGNRAPLSKSKDVNSLRRPSAVVDQVVKYLGQEVERGSWIWIWEKAA